MKIRQGTEADLPDLLRLIIELAVYEKEPNAVLTTVESMREDCFGKNPIFGFFVAERNKEIVGVSVYYYRYSTWKGRRLYLEDLVVTESCRGQGVGKALFERTIRKAHDDGCHGMSWQVLDWNEPAVRFYEKYGARIDKGWWNCRFNEEQLKVMTSDFDQE